jgi:hypothetical protein
MATTLPILGGMTGRESGQSLSSARCVTRKGRPAVTAISPATLGRAFAAASVRARSTQMERAPGLEPRFPPWSGSVLLGPRALIVSSPPRAGCAALRVSRLAVGRCLFDPETRSRCRRGALTSSHLSRPRCSVSQRTSRSVRNCHSEPILKARILPSLIIL